jgi:hypothetical protein
MYSVDPSLGIRLNSTRVCYSAPGVSDHDALLVTLSVSSVRPVRASREVYNFDKADWDGLNSALATKLVPVLQQQDVTTAWEMWKSV